MDQGRARPVHTAKKKGLRVQALPAALVVIALGYYTACALMVRVRGASTVEG